MVLETIALPIALHSYVSPPKQERPGPDSNRHDRGLEASGSAIELPSHEAPPKQGTTSILQGGVPEMRQCVGREHSMTAIRLYSFGPSFHDFIIPHFFAFFIREIFPK